MSGFQIDSSLFVFLKDGSGYIQKSVVEARKFIRMGLHGDLLKLVESYSLKTLMEEEWNSESSNRCDDCKEKFYDYMTPLWLRPIRDPTKREKWKKYVPGYKSNPPTFRKILVVEYLDTEDHVSRNSGIGYSQVCIQCLEDFYFQYQDSDEILPFYLIDNFSHPFKIEELKDFLMCLLQHRKGSYRDIFIPVILTGKDIWFFIQLYKKYLDLLRSGLSDLEIQEILKRRYLI